MARRTDVSWRGEAMGSFENEVTSRVGSRNGAMGPTTGRSRFGNLRNGVLLCAASWLAWGCETQTVLLGSGNDADAAAMTSERGSTQVRATSSADQTALSSAGSDGATCDGDYASCLEHQGGAMCTNVLIFCRIAPADGGTLECDEVNDACSQLGYSAAECSAAVEVCEEGGAFMIIPGDEVTLSGDFTGL